MRVSNRLTDDDVPHPVWLFNNHKQQSFVFDYRILTGSLNYYFLHYGFHQWAFASQSHHYFKNNVFYAHALNDALITYIITVIECHDWLIEINRLLIIMITGWILFGHVYLPSWREDGLLVMHNNRLSSKFDFRLGSCTHICVVGLITYQPC